MIEERIGAALEKMRLRKMKPRAVYLSPADFKAFKKARTRIWKSEVVPLAVMEVPIISESLIGEMVPVRPTGKPRSTVYSTNGVEVAVPVRLSKRTEVRG